METYNCIPSVTPSKFRPDLPSNFYHNVPRSVRQIASEYSLPNCTGRRSGLSLTHTPAWQERPHRTPMSCIAVEQKKSRGRLCSIALAIASFIVLVAVLAIAGLALYMGVLHSETPNALITFSCSAKVLRGDRFVGALQEKSRKYKRQFETLYQKSILGQALISCIVDKFGNDTLTIYFRLAFNRRKLSKNVSSIEKAIKDILLTDAISRNSVFKNIRFEPRHVTVKQVSDYSVPQTVFSDVKSPATKSGVVLKSSNKSTFPYSFAAKKPVVVDDLENINEEDLPVIQGSFKISKTEADITEKKTEASTSKPKAVEKLTTPFAKRTTLKESAATVPLHKIAAIEKVSKQTIFTSTTRAATTRTTTAAPTTTTTIKPVFISNPFNEEPWIPILPDLSVITENSQVLTTKKYVPSSTVPTITGTNQIRPVYTSFTNPGLSLNFNEAERLGSTSLKSHPIPVNKIPFTEPSVFSLSNTEPNKNHQTDLLTESSESVTVNSDTNESSEHNRQATSFVEVETLQYIPGSNLNNQSKTDEVIQNITTIFHDVAPPYSNSDTPEDLESFNQTEEVSGHGQVEVVMEDTDDLMLHTTKVPLVTLLPVKSNSGIGRPIRKRPQKPSSNNVSVENRSFPNVNTQENNVKSGKNDFNIVGMLNFAPEITDIETEGKDVARYPKMDEDYPVKKSVNESQVAVYSTNSSVSNNAGDRNGSNILSPEKLKQLSEISKIFDNSTAFDSTPVISTKAVSSSYTINHAGFKMLTKTFNKINSLETNDTKRNKLVLNTTDCGLHDVRCGDGTCLPETTKCNQLIDCNDGKDELNCNCADYLKSQDLSRKVCDGVVDCWDYTDENKCEWCKPHQYVCGNSKQCIDNERICDGLKDCPHGDDERQCVTIAANVRAADHFFYYSEGYLMVRKHGEWGKFCVDNLENVASASQIAWQLSDLGKAVCRSMTYKNMDFVNITAENEESTQTKYFELAYTSQNETKSSLSFKATSCSSRQTVEVRCQSLECGARPQVVKHIARVVGGGNAGLGAWPWQAALYKEGEFQCGATLLSSGWLVSAGHCFYHSQEEHWVARLGALRRGTTLPSPYEQLRAIIRIVIHPGYIHSGFINDISLLQMELPVVFSDYVRPVCLPPPDQLPLDGRLCTVIGWGQLFEVGRIFPDTLQEVQVPIISTGECRKRTLFLPLYRITDDMFCAGYERGGRDACLGDSGGPLMCPEDNGRWTLHGITSNGYGCARANRPGVYTKVANYVEWIDLTINADEITLKNVTAIKNVCPGHRCPLGECLPESRLCNGYIECSDGSDEKNCENMGRD